MLVKIGQNDGFYSGFKTYFILDYLTLFGSRCLNYIKEITERLDATFVNIPFSFFKGHTLYMTFLIHFIPVESFGRG